MQFSVSHRRRLSGEELISTHRKAKINTTTTSTTTTTTINNNNINSNNNDNNNNTNNNMTVIKYNRNKLFSSCRTALFKGINSKSQRSFHGVSSARECAGLW